MKACQYSGMPSYRQGCLKYASRLIAALPTVESQNRGREAVTAAVISAEYQ